MNDQPPPKRLLDLFCGVGGWSKAFLRRGWHCVGVDLCALGYPGEFIQTNVLDLSRSFVDSFDAVVASPPCEEFARAWLPWLRGDHKPEQWAIDLLKWSVGLCDRPRRIVECSIFASRHVAGAVRCGSYCLWGDVPLLLPPLARRSKMDRTGMRPDLRAEIPPALADWIADRFSHEPSDD